MTTKTKLTLACIVIAAIFLPALHAYFNLPSVHQKISLATSEAIGLNPTITLYTGDGKPIKSWKGLGNTWR
jgi:hypothetical protein